MSFDWRDTLISQYANSPTLMQLVESMADYFDPTADLDAFYNMIWNVDTAQGYGLDVWGRIVGVGRVLQVSDVEFFDFEESGISAHSFGEAPFYNGGGLTSNYPLSDTAYRTLILAKALANICDGSIPAINQILLNLFPGRGDCYVIDNQNMSMSYAFTFDLTPVETAIVSQSGVLPQPDGVLVSVVHVAPGPPDGSVFGLADGVTAYGLEDGTTYLGLEV